MKKLNVNEELIKKIAKKGAAFVLAGTMALGAASATTEGNIPFAVVASAQENNELDAVQLEVQTGLNLYMDDKGFIPRDVNGNETYPFISNGTTYVPVRAISELFNADVKWDSKMNRVTITTKNSKANLTHTIREKNELVTTTITAHKGVKLYIDGKECIPKDVNGNVKDIYIVNGTTYVPVRAVSNALGLPISWSEKTNSVFIGKHKTEGLTAENINNYEKFCEIVENNFYYGDSQFVLDIDGARQYFIDCDCFEEKALFICMLNREYISDELYKQLLKDYDLDSFYNASGYYRAASGQIIDVDDNDMVEVYDWNSCVVDPDYAAELSKFQEICYKSRVEHDDTELIEYIINYFSNYKDKGRDFLDYTVAQCWTKMDSESYKKVSKKLTAAYYSAKVDIQFYYSHVDVIVGIQEKYLAKKNNT